MNGRNIVLAAVALGLVALIIVFFASAGDTGGEVAQPGSRPAVAASEGAEPGAAPATTGGAAAEAPPVSRAAARAAKAVEGEPVASKLELPPEAKPEDGGLAFGAAVCEKMQSCSCQDRPVENCARGWISVKPEDWSTYSCMLDLSCQDICRISEHPKDVACLARIDEMVTKRFRDRKIE